MAPVTELDYATTVAFRLTIDGESLGDFSGCDGLGCEVVLESREEGGNNGFVWQLPTRVKYTNVKLTRVLSSDTEKVTTWLSGVVNGYQRRTATITALRTNGQPVASWSLEGVVPVRWSGPSFSADSSKVLTETLEIAHQGFITSGKG